MDNPLVVVSGLVLIILAFLILIIRRSVVKSLNCKIQVAINDLRSEFYYAETHLQKLIAFHGLEPWVSSELDIFRSDYRNTLDFFQTKLNTATSISQRKNLLHTIEKQGKPEHAVSKIIEDSSAVRREQFAKLSSCVLKLEACAWLLSAHDDHPLVVHIRNLNRTIEGKKLTPSEVTALIISSDAMIARYVADLMNVPVDIETQWRKLRYDCSTLRVELIVGEYENCDAIQVLTNILDRYSHQDLLAIGQLLQARREAIKLRNNASSAAKVASPTDVIM